MIDATGLSLMVQSTALLILLWIILFRLWPAVRLDCFRQQMFKVRDELFDYAASGKISFDHPAYRLLRQSMNGFIRYGHRISFYQFAMTYIEWKTLEARQSFEWAQKWRTALDSLDRGTRVDLERFHGRASMHVTKRIIFGSPVLILLLLTTMVAVLFHFGWKSASDLVKTAISQIADKAIDQRILDEEAARAAA